ncbi:MAG TPA: nitrilotriacetate monooxygenase, partial [Polyangiales bacterium]|nr:nitrilotriacetate monooxygenase [Polyangiales bacterium]
KNTAREEGLTLRQAAYRFARSHSQFVGSAQTVADQMERWFQDEACDGFNVGVGEPGELDTFIAQVLPLLRQKGLFRREYEHSTLRENLGLKIPQNRHTVARESERAAAE